MKRGISLLAQMSTMNPRYNSMLFKRTFRMFSKKPEDFMKATLKDEQDPKGTIPGQIPGEEVDLNENPFENNKTSYYNEKKVSYYFFIGASVTLIGLYFMMQMNAMKKKKKTERNSITSVGKANIGGEWQLSTLDGKTIGSNELDGKYYLIYFGFSRCPDVCPQTLSKITKALEIMRNVSEKKYFDLETIFVTLDPDRDTNEDIMNFLKHFDKSIIPVTAKSNDDPRLTSMLSKFKIYATKIELEDEAYDPNKEKPYTLDHTIITYLMDDENYYLSHIGSNMSSSEIAQHIVSKIMQNQREKLIKN